jgi:hypothetical protein
VNSAQEQNVKTPPESDPRKENRNVPPGNEASPGPEDFDDIRPKDDDTVRKIDAETPGLTGN